MQTQYKKRLPEAKSKMGKPPYKTRHKPLVQKTY